MTRSKEKPTLHVMIVRRTKQQIEWTKRVITHELGIKRVVFSGATSGEEATTYLRYSIIPDLLILDMSLSDMSGTDLLRGVREDVKADVPIVMVSGTKKWERISSAYRKNIEIIVSDDANAEEMAHIINMVLSRSQGFSVSDILDGIDEDDLL